MNKNRNADFNIITFNVKCRTAIGETILLTEHLNISARPSLRGSCPLDVAYSSLMDNNELALALRESHLEKIALYLSRCGLQMNSELSEKGYPDIGWDPVEGERFLDFLRFCVWVNGKFVLVTNMIWLSCKELVSPCLSVWLVKRCFFSMGYLKIVIGCYLIKTICHKITPVLFVRFFSNFYTLLWLMTKGSLSIFCAMCAILKQNREYIWQLFWINVHVSDRHKI